MKLLTIFILLITFFTLGFAQRYDENNNYIASFNYNISVPTGSLKDFIDETSYYGWNFDFGYVFDRKFEIGGRAGLYDFYQEFRRDTYSNGNAAVTANKFQRVKEFEMMANGRYFPFALGYTKPIFGMGAGFTKVTKTVLYGRYGSGEQKWVFSFAPELGFRTQLGPKRLWLNTLVRYHYSFFDMGDGNLQNFKFNFGLSFIM